LLDVEEVNGYPLSNFYSIQENAWMFLKLVVNWIEKIYGPWALTKTEPTMLIVDEFSGHMTREVRDAVASYGGLFSYTWCLQVIDVRVNRPCNNGIHNSYDNFCIANDVTTNPKREDVSVWMRDAFEYIK
jgi:hypothetical protein